MAGILRESCLEIIDKTYEAINSSLDGKNVDSNIWLKDLSARMERINRLRKKKDYLETIKCLDRDGLQEYFNLVGRMARELRLPIYSCFVNKEIAEEQELLTLYANGVVHERGKSIEIDQGMRIRFRLESKNQDAKQRVEVEWDKKRKGKEEQEGFYEALNDIKNMVDTDSLDREFAFEQVGEYKVSAAVYKYMKKNLVKKIKTLAQEYECTVIVNEGEGLYEGMEFKDKLWEALSAVDWKGVVQDSMFDVTSQLPIMVGTIVLLSGVLIAISMSPIGWLAPLVGTAMQVFGLSGAVEDVVKGIYMFTDAVLRIRDAKSKAGMSQATQHLEESFRQVAPSLMLDVLLFLGGKRVAGNPTGSDLVQEVPRAKSKPQVKPNETQKIVVEQTKEEMAVLLNKKHPHNFTRHGNFGEMVVDVDLEGTGHIKRISMRRVTDLDAPMHHGIDGVYENYTPPPKYLIVESKYLSSEAAKSETFAPKMTYNKSSDITQLNNEWIRKNLSDQFKDADGFISSENRVKIDEILDAIDDNDDAICMRLGAKIDNSGNVTYYKYNFEGIVLKEEIVLDGKTKKHPVIWDKGKENIR